MPSGYCLLPNKKTPIKPNGGLFVPNPKQRIALESFTFVPKPAPITPCLFSGKLV